MNASGLALALAFDRQQRIAGHDRAADGATTKALITSPGMKAIDPVNAAVRPICAAKAG